MKKHLLKYSLLLFLLITVDIVKAQGSGSVDAEYGFGSSAGDTTATAAETLFIGPGTYTINGYWKIYNKYIWIDPTAIISGSGLIQFYNPSVAGATSSPTYIDGNNTLINVNVELDNAQNMVLVDMTDPGFGEDNVGNATVYVGQNFNFGINNGNVILGDIFSDPSSQNTTVANTSSTLTDFIFTSTATVSNYQPSRMVVTSNSIQGHMVKENYTGSFVFPVGISAGDYTPAQITNTSSNTIHVSVQDYPNSASNETTLPVIDGMMRTWNIYAGNASGNSLINLEHNTSTDQSSFNESNHYITRWGNTTPNTTGDNSSSSAWQSNTLGAGTLGNLSSSGSVTGSSMRSRSYTTFATADTAAIAYFSKSSSITGPLAVVLSSFNVVEQNGNSLLQWETSSELNTNRFEIERSTDNGASWQIIGEVNAAGNSDVARDYSYLDINPVNGIDMYRLQIVDNNGSVTYSSVKELVFGGNSETVSVYPNPIIAGSTLNVELSGFVAGNYKLYLVSTSGQLVNGFTTINITETGNRIFPVLLQHLTSGDYIIIVEGNNKQYSKKITLLNK